MSCHDLRHQRAFKILSRRYANQVHLHYLNNAMQSKTLV